MFSCLSAVPLLGFRCYLEVMHYAVGMWLYWRSHERNLVHILDEL